MTLARAGLPLDAYFSASKLAWIIENVPAARDALDAGHLRLGTTDAFFLDRLTGNFATDVTTASRTSLMNIETGEWDVELCRLFGVPIACLPKIHPTVAAFGSVKGMPITAAVVDQQAALLRPRVPEAGRCEDHVRNRGLRLGSNGRRRCACARKRSVANGGLVDRWPHDLCRRRRCLRCRLGGRVGPPHRLVSDLATDLDRFEAPPAIERRASLSCRRFRALHVRIGIARPRLFSSECRPRQRGPIFVRLFSKASRSARQTWSMRWTRLLQLAPPLPSTAASLAADTSRSFLQMPLVATFFRRISANAPPLARRRSPQSARARYFPSQRSFHLYSSRAPVSAPPRAVTDLVRLFTQQKLAVLNSEEARRDYG